MKYRVTLEIISKIAVGARMTKMDDTKAPGTISFADFEEIA